MKHWDTKPCSCPPFHLKKPLFVSGKGRPIGAPPDLAQLVGDRRLGCLGCPQRELMRKAVQCHSQLLRPLDPALCPQAETQPDTENSNSWGSMEDLYGKKMKKGW